MGGLITEYLGAGLAAARPATPTLSTGAIGLWWSTDTNHLDLWDGAAWESNLAGGGGGGGGALEKLADVTVAVAQQDIDFTSLDLDTDGFYVIEMIYVPAATGDKTIYLYYNADLTAANYNATLFYSDGSSPGGFATNTAYAFSVGTGTIYTARVKMEIGKVAGHRPRATVGVSGRAAAGLRSMSNGHEWTGTANVTAIKLRHADAGGFAVGTRARLYRLN